VVLRWFHLVLVEQTTRGKQNRVFGLAYAAGELKLGKIIS
jgi:hypothetical protein